MSSADSRTARCGCGTLTATAVGVSGSAFTYSAVFPQDAVTIAGEHRTWRHHGNSGRWIESNFCPYCGIAVFSRSEIFPGMIGVAAGCFTDPHFPPPQRVYWTSRQHRWLAFPPDVARHDTQLD